MKLKKILIDYSIRKHICFNIIFIFQYRNSIAKVPINQVIKSGNFFIFNNLNLKWIIKIAV